MILFKCYSAESKDPTLLMTTTWFKNEPHDLPILWNYKGLFRIILSEKVANMREAIKDSENLSPIAKNKQVGTFYWEDGITVDPKVARILLSNQ